MGAVSGPEGTDRNHGQRTLGSKIEDQSIETKAKVNLRKVLKDYNQSHLEVVSFNGIALLLGQVPNIDQKKIAANTIQNVRHVHKVHNKLTIENQTPYHQRIRDSWLTYRIKLRFFFAEGFPSGRVKVVTEKGIVYLLGLVTEKEANRATAISRRVKGVKKVVKVFEFINQTH